MTRIRITIVAVLAIVLVGSALAASAAPDRAAGNGNNGTVKIDLLPVDDTSPQNQPHVGCPFGVDWYGFDASAATTVSFQIWPPSNATGGREQLLMNVLDPAGGLIAQTDAYSFNLDADGPAGGGSEAGWDGAISVDLTPGLLQYGEYAAGHGAGHPENLADDKKPADDGYHVKMTVRTETSNGADVKHKVFWTGLCDQGTPGGTAGH